MRWIKQLIARLKGLFRLRVIQFFLAEEVASPIINSTVLNKYRKNDDILGEQHIMVLPHRTGRLDSAKRTRNTSNFASSASPSPSSISVPNSNCHIRTCRQWYACRPKINKKQVRSTWTYRRYLRALMLQSSGALVQRMEAKLRRNCKYSCV